MKKDFLVKTSVSNMMYSADFNPQLITRHIEIRNDSATEDVTERVLKDKDKELAK